MRPFIIGTAGHVDHGKTSLIRFLTGVNTDRLREEQARGITIELGFAPLEMTRGDQKLEAGIVDVPGHERFVKHMVAGAGGVDLLLMVVAADEGVMPQTREHLDICRLLDVRTGVIVLTKVDLVDEEWLELVSEDVRGAFEGTFLEDAPVVHFTTRPDDPDAQRARVMEELWAARDRVSARDDDALFRLPVDRVFTMRGHGTVLTGTVVGGTVDVGDDVVLIPGEERSRVRSLQSFGRKVESASAGTRTAVNLQGSERSSVARGMVAVHPGTLEPTDTIDVKMRYLPHNPKPLLDRAAVIFHVGSANANGAIRLIGRDILNPGEEGVVRVHLEEPVVALPGDRFIVRGYADIPGHGKTLGGGEILHLSGGPYRVSLKGAKLSTYLTALAGADAEGRLRPVLDAAGHAGLDVVGLAARTGLGPRRVQALLDELAAAGQVHPVEEQPRVYLDDAVVRRLGDWILRQIEAYLGENPLEEGLRRERIRSQVRPPIAARALGVVLEALAGDGRIELDREKAGLPGRQAELKGAHAELAGQVGRALRDAGASPPRLDQLAETLGASRDDVRAVVGLLARRGEFIRVSDGLYFAPDALADIREKIVAHLKARGELSTQEFKELTGLTRRWLIPLSEYFDNEKLTVRKGDVRVLR